MKSIWMIVGMLLTNAGVFCTSATLLIFQGAYNEPLTDDAGMNIAHQALGALLQKAAPLLISCDVWNHIIHRRFRFNQDIHYSPLIVDLVSQVNQKIQQGLSLQEINQRFDVAWFNSSYPTLSELSQNEYTKKLFDYFCSHIDQIIQTWHLYLVNGYILCVQKDQAVNFLINQALLYPFDDACKGCPVDHSVSLAHVLKKILVKQGLHWKFYVTGHGYHCDHQHQESILAGMTLTDFNEFLRYLNHDISTKLLVYSSCYSAGSHLIEPYELAGSNLVLNYPVIITCLTDAPVYVFGLPAGIKLPPYNKTIFLEKSDIYNNQLYWFLMQDFKKLANGIKTKDSFLAIAQAIMPYQECNNLVCHLEKLENIPLVRKAGMSYFIPLDSKYVDCVVHNVHAKIAMRSRKGLLWYTKQYQGIIDCDQEIPYFVCMVPGPGVVWINTLQAFSVTLQDFIKQAFFGVEDHAGQSIWLFNTLQTLDNQIMQGMIIPGASMIAQSLKINKPDSAFYFQKIGIWHKALISSTGIIESIQRLDGKNGLFIEKLWNLLRKESKFQHNISPDQLWSSHYIKLRKHNYEKLTKTIEQLVM